MNIESVIKERASAEIIKIETETAIELSKLEDIFNNEYRKRLQEKKNEFYQNLAIKKNQTITTLKSKNIYTIVKFKETLLKKLTEKISIKSNEYFSDNFTESLITLISAAARSINVSQLNIELPMQYHTLYMKNKNEIESFYKKLNLDIEKVYFNEILKNGVKITTTDGKIIIDNSLDSRLLRYEDQLTKKLFRELDHE